MSGSVLGLTAFEWLTGKLIYMPLPIGYVFIVADTICIVGLIVYLWLYEPNAHRKWQISVVFFGALFQFAILLVIGLVGFRINNSPIWLLSSLILPITVFVAIFRGRFMDVELQRGFVYSIVIVALTATYIGIFYVIARIGTQSQNVLLVIGISVVVALSFIPAVFLSRRLTDFVVYRDLYDFRGLLSKLAADITSFQDATELAKMLSIRLTECLNLDGCAVVSHLTTPPTILTAIGTLEDIDLSKVNAYPPTVTHIFLMTVKEQNVGAILLSCKRSKTQLRTIDRDLLMTIAHQAAVALVNFQLVEDLNARIKRLEVSEQERRILHLRLMQSEEQERARLSRELHDGALQSLFHLIRQCEVSSTDEQENLVKRLGYIGDLGRDIAYELREVCRDLRPNNIDQMGLANALEVLIDRINHNSSCIKCKFTVSEEVMGQRNQINSDSEMVLYRIVQEALSNVQRHANAERVTVKLHCGIDAVYVMVVDDGIGFAVDENEFLSLVDAGHFGVVGMRERVEGLGGQLRITRIQPHGTEVKVVVPMTTTGARTELLNKGEQPSERVSDVSR
ncbi:sensor histidine kinase [Alicyclobacillus tolerans]|uniref:sensor histidine kinase n=1 Tax=Alicyclobacillus tolerans TaxID=90970 RepID=UPI003B76D598